MEDRFLLVILWRRLIRWPSINCSLVLGLVIALPTTVYAERISDVRNTKHNFSRSALDIPSAQQSNVVAARERQICIFCHTPHAATASQAPLWNRALSTSGYQLYNSTSTDALSLESALSQPNGSSKLCLSCHDGTLAIGSVNVLNGSFTDQEGLTEDIAMNGTGNNGTIAVGEGALSGYTSLLGTDMGNDHPISLRFDKDLADLDGELRYPDEQSHLVVRVQGTPAPPSTVPLEIDGNTTTGGLVQCTSCHDPHIRDTEEADIKFLRLNRLQKVDPFSPAYSAKNDIMCIACHDKAGWVGSAHANADVADEAYTLAARVQLNLPLNTRVWQTSCISCHDTHTVSGSRRLLREGVDGSTTASESGFLIKTGDGQSAIEETCYGCHSNDGGILTSQGFNTKVADIKSDFALNIHMPITSNEQRATIEVHDIGIAGEAGTGADFVESQVKLGKGMPDNRHAECSDCHNPHRVIRNRLFNDDPSITATSGTHNHTEPHSNIISGVLKGSWGVEPLDFFSEEFTSEPITFEIKRGNPLINASDLVGQPYVTREYQICLKCHSNYAYDTPPLLNAANGGTFSGTNGMFRYTNQAMEFQSPDSHRGPATSLTSSGAGIQWQTNNHRSWHPVMNSTGRSKAERRMLKTGVMLPPFDNHMGSQTMYCSDCHGSNTLSDTVVPDGGEDGRAWGPHGSENDFLLKGKWDQTTGTVCTGINCPPETRGDQQNDLCFKCHNRFNYAEKNAVFGDGESGFSGMAEDLTPAPNLHIRHIDKLGRIKCNWCHVAVPHGWKNKDFLVNLNDVGPEVNFVKGTEIPSTVDSNNVTQLYFNGPYYNGAVNKVVQFATSGNWIADSCGTTNGIKGIDWMKTACNNLP